MGKSIKQQKSAIVEPSKPSTCDLCLGVGYIQLKKGGEVKTCQECLKSGKLDQSN